MAALVCDLTYHHLTDRKNGVTVSRSNRHLERRSRYKAPVETGKLPAVLDSLAAPELGFIEQAKGEADPAAFARTVVFPQGPLVSLIDGFDLSDLSYSLDAETIILRAEKERDDEPGEDLEYGDTPDTLRYRAEMREINEWLASADIDFDDSAAPNKVVDANMRPLRRIFNGTFEEGGRLFGGFWQDVTKGQRAEGLTIDGEAVVTLDYGQMTPRILYGWAKVEPPAGDLYSIPGLDHHRDGVKKVLNAALFSDKPLTRKPQGSTALLPSIPYAAIEAMIAEAHPVIAAQFGRGVGLRAQFIESQILVRVLLELKAQGVVALPVHDALIVKRSVEEVVSGTMKSVFKEMVGVEGHVSEDR